VSYWCFVLSSSFACFLAGCWSQFGAFFLLRFLSAARRQCHLLLQAVSFWFGWISSASYIHEYSSSSCCCSSIPKEKESFLSIDLSLSSFPLPYLFLASVGEEAEHLVLPLLPFLPPSPPSPPSLTTATAPSPNTSQSTPGNTATPPPPPPHSPHPWCTNQSH
jgi:hypothetical protein